MAPQRPRKQKTSSSSSSTTANLPEFPMPPSAAKHSSPARTPTRSPIKRKTMAITHAQKQALIDNLQLEITERARKLRAQYADQAHSLRSRLEMRISRVPKALRVVKMGELFAGHWAPEVLKARRAVDGGPGSKLETRRAAPSDQASSRIAASKDHYLPSRGTKRTSDESFSSEDKENATQMELSNPKKRTKTTDRPESPKRAVNTKLQQNQILSPKSSNSRTLPKSPIRPGMSPGKSFLARPVSPLKGAPSQNKVSGTLVGLVEKAKNIRALPSKKTAVVPAAGGARAKKGAPVSTTQTQAKDRDISNSSSNSTGTIVTAAKGRKPPVVKKATTTTAARKVPPKAEATTAAKRILRKRN